MVKPAEPSTATSAAKKEQLKGKNVRRIAGLARSPSGKKKKERQENINNNKLNARGKVPRKTQARKRSLDMENVSVKDLKNALLLLKRRKLTLTEVISQIKSAKALEAKYGKPYNAILDDYKTKIEQVTKAAASLREIEDLEKNHEARISDLRDLEALKSLLDKNEASAEETTEYIRQYKKLGQFGFEVNTVKSIAEEIKRLQFDPNEISKLLGSWLTKYKSINEALVRAENQVEEAKNDEALTIARTKSLDRKAEEAQKKIDALENYYVRRSESLEAEYKNRERVLDTRYVEERSRAEAELLDILRDRDKMRSENRELRDELEATKKEIELARSLSTIIRDPNSLTASQLDLLVSEFLKAKKTRERENRMIPSPSSERLIQARQMLVSALRDLDNNGE